MSEKSHFYFRVRRAHSHSHYTFLFSARCRCCCCCCCWPLFSHYKSCGRHSPKNIIYANEEIKMETKQPFWREPKKIGCTSTTIQSSISRHAIAAYCLCGWIQGARAQGYPIERCADAVSTNIEVYQLTQKIKTMGIDAAMAEVDVFEFVIITSIASTRNEWMCGRIFVHIGYCLCFLFRASHYLHTAYEYFVNKQHAMGCHCGLVFCCRFNVTWTSYWISIEANRRKFRSLSWTAMYRFSAVTFISTIDFLFVNELGTNEIPHHAYTNDGWPLSSPFNHTQFERDNWWKNRNYRFGNWIMQSNNNNNNKKCYPRIE